MTSVGRGRRHQIADVDVVAAARRPCVGARRRPWPAGRGQRGEQEPEVAQRDVVVVGLEQQVDDDPGQPCGDEVAAELGPDGDDQSGDDLDDADGSIAWCALPGIRSLICGAR